MNVLRVDLDAFAGNLHAIASRVAPAAPMLVVKDDAYGHGLARIVARARAEGIGWFGAFDVGTALAVRAASDVSVRVFAWSIHDDDAADAVAHGIDAGVGDLETLLLLADEARHQATTALVHLKIDTGLHRSGVRPEQWNDVVARAATLVEEGVIDVVGIWSHLAESSDEEDDEARDIFVAAAEAAERAGLRPRLRHLAASAAAFARAEFRLDLVRVGAFAYGIRSAGGPHETTLGLNQIATLSATVAEVGETTVTVAIGALDGLPSPIAGRLRVKTPGGQRMLRSIAGGSSEVETWPGARIGDEVVIYGSGASSSTDLGELIGSIGEEIAVRISPLVERRYEERAVREGSAVRPTR